MDRLSGIIRNECPALLHLDETDSRYFARRILRVKIMNSRWIAKRSLKWAAELAAKYSGLAALRRKSRYYQNSFRVLTYHKITDNPKTTHDLSEKHFTEHCRILSGEFNVVSLKELVDQCSKGTRPKPDSVALTFDDGYNDLSGVVGETLLKYGLTATFFIVTGFVDKTVNSGRGPYVNWTDLRRLSQAGFSIGSHSVSHASMNDLDFQRLEFELSHSRDRIRSELGHDPCGFSYPYGTLRDFSDVTREAVIESGYPWAVTAIHGVNSLGADIYSLKRINMTCGDGPRTLRLIMEGCLDVWGLIDRVAYRLQRPYYRGAGDDKRN